MAVAAITAKVPKLGDRVVTTNYDFGDNCQGAIKLFGEEAVYNAYKAESVIALQARMRDWAIKGKSDAEIQQLANQWKPGVSAPRIGLDPVKRYQSYLDGLTEDKALEQLESLKKLLAAKKAAAAKK